MIFQNANSTLDSCLSSSIVMLTQCIGTAVTVLIVDRYTEGGRDKRPSTSRYTEGGRDFRP